MLSDIQNKCWITTKVNILNMSQKKLQEDLEKLRAEIKNISADDNESREKLNALVAQLDTEIKSTGESENPGISQNIKDAINHFETEHPRATAILNDIMVTLSNMGI